MNVTPSLNDDVIDLRDVIARAEELETLAESLGIEPRDDMGESEMIDAGMDGDDACEMVIIRDLLAELRGNGGDEQWRGDWYPVTLIRDSYFTEYARELVQDIGDLPSGIPAYLEIDWDATAQNIRVDYSPVEIDGVTYWYR